MRALLVSGPDQFGMADVPAPRPARGEVLVAIRAAGICGTDLHVASGAFGQFPRIPGHDVCGVVDEVGEGVATTRLGQRVTIDPAACCVRSAPASAGQAVEACWACASGRTHLCDDGTYLGIHVDGAFCDRVAVPALRAVSLPDELSDVAATVLEPVTVALHLKQRIADREGKVLVIGAGPIGLVAGFLLSASGREVTLVEPVEARRQLAEALGLQCLRPSDVTSVRDASVLVEASGHASAGPLLLMAARRGSTIVLIGGATELPGREILTRELEVRAVKGGRGLYDKAIQWAQNSSFDLERLVSHRFAFEDAERAFRETMARPGEIFRSVLLTDA